MRVLIVEDQQGPREVLEFAVKKALPIVAPGFTKADYDVAGCYDRAGELVEQTRYDVVLLDHRMPVADQGDLEERDLSAYSGTLRNIGYSLIPRIRELNPAALVVGTSSLNKDELGRVAQPDCTINKTWSEAQQGLEEALKAYKR